MKFLLPCFGWLCVGWFTACAMGAGSSPWEKSLVTLEITRQHYDYFQPWSKRTETLHKTGVVIGEGQVLTTAEYLNDSTLIRLQKQGRGTWFLGHITWLDYHANLAVVTSPTPAFWKELKPVSLADPVPVSGNLRIARWRNGNLDIRKAEFTRFLVKRSKLSYTDLPCFELTSEMAGGGWAEAVICGSKLAGLITSQDGNNGAAVPSSFIKPLLVAHQKAGYPGLGFFDFVWQKVDNTATLRHLKLEGEPRGVLVVDNLIPFSTNQLRARDILLEIDGHAIDNEGDYKDPEYGNLSLEYLASNHRLAGDKIQMKIWRDGSPQEVYYTLPKADYDVELVPDAVYDRPPDYCLVGGLVFQPLTGMYLRNWGTDWRRKAPFRLAYYTEQKRTPERPSLVILSQVLPDPLNLGYQDYRFLTIDKINNLPISTLSDLTNALRAPVNGFHLVDFMPSDLVHRMILDAGQIEAANQRIMQRYGVEKERVLTK